MPPSLLEHSAAQLASLTGTHMPQVTTQHRSSEAGLPLAEIFSALFGLFLWLHLGQRGHYHLAQTMGMLTLPGVSYQPPQ